MPQPLVGRLGCLSCPIAHCHRPLCCLVASTKLPHTEPGPLWNTLTWGAFALVLHRFTRRPSSHSRNSTGAGGFCFLPKGWGFEARLPAKKGLPQFPLLFSEAGGLHDFKGCFQAQRGYTIGERSLFDVPGLFFLYVSSLLGILNPFLSEEN